MLNLDAGGGVLDEKTGKPEYFTWQGAEKTYADFKLSVTNPGGHSSEPRKDNAITQLAAALVRIGNYRFKPEIKPAHPAYFTEAAKYEADPKTAAAMRAFAANPADKSAIDTLAADPAMVGKIGTTCVATMISGGHALNALPQRAEANINCRIFPGHSRADIMAELKKVAAEPALTISDVTQGSRRHRCLAQPSRFRGRGEQGDGGGLSRRAGLPVDGVRRQRQHVVPFSQGAQLWRQPDLHQTVGKFQPRPQRAHAHLQHRARDRL